MERSLEEVYRKVDARRAKLGDLTETEIQALVQKYRHGKN